MRALWRGWDMVLPVLWSMVEKGDPFYWRSHNLQVDCHRDEYGGVTVEVTGMDGVTDVYTVEFTKVSGGDPEP